MTIQSTVNDGITYSGNDSATTFAFPFKVDLNTQIEVIIRDALGVETTAILNTDYTVAGFKVEGSGVVTYPISGDPLATGKKITIKPKMDYLQSTDIRNQGRFAPEIHENAFDTLMMHIKELKGEINRTIQFKKSSEITGAEFGVDPEDGKIVAWDGATGKTKNVVAVDSALVTTFWETILANTNLSDSLDDLGIPAFSQALLAATTAAIARGTLDAEQIINSLTAITTLQDADQIGVADNSDSDNSKKITFQNLAKALINGLTAITTLQDSDQISIADNSDSDNSKKITLANFKTAINVNNATVSSSGVSYLPKRITISIGVDTDHDIDFSDGNFIFDDGTGQMAANALTKQIDASWVSGNNAGGLDTGSVIADTTYHCFAIYNPTTSTADFLFSTSISNPTLPSGYTKKTRVGSILTNSSGNILSFKQVGKYFFFNLGGGILDLSLTSGIATTKTNISVSLPAGIDCIGLFRGHYNRSSGQRVYFFNSNEEDFAPSTSRSDFHNDSTWNSSKQDIQKYVSNGVLPYRSSASTANALDLYTKGWIDINLM